MLGWDQRAHKPGVHDGGRKSAGREKIRRGAVAALTGINIETVRHYERIGLLPAPTLTRPWGDPIGQLPPSISFIGGASSATPTELNGLGVPHDSVQAHMWFNLAAAQGNEDALENCDNLAAEMLSADVAKAQCMAREWQAKYGKANLRSA